MRKQNLIISVLIVSILSIHIHAFTKMSDYFINLRILGGIGANVGAKSEYTNKMAGFGGGSLLFKTSGSGLLTTSFGLESRFVRMGKLLNTVNVHYLNIAILAEAEYRHFLFQFGAGPYIALGGKHHTQYGFFTGLGYNAMLADVVSIPILFRVDFLESRQISLAGSLGLSFYF